MLFNCPDQFSFLRGKSPEELSKIKIAVRDVSFLSLEHLQANELSMECSVIYTRVVAFDWLCFSLLGVMIGLLFAVCDWMLAASRLAERVEA